MTCSIMPPGHDEPMATSDPCPYPVPRAYIRALCEAVATGESGPGGSRGQREAARMLKTGDRTVRYWCSELDPKVCPWASAELLRRMLIERDGTDRKLPDPRDFPPDPDARDLPVMTP
jgi:hypothetical protein